MTNIFRDGNRGFVTLVEHGPGNELVVGVNGTTVQGLTEYCVDGDGNFEIFDIATETFYAEDTRMENLDVEAKEAVLNPGRVLDLNDEYYQAVTNYEETL